METKDFTTENIIFTNNSQKLNYTYNDHEDINQDNDKCNMLSILQYLTYYLNSDKTQKVILNGYYSLYLEKIFKLFPILEWHLYGTSDSYVKKYNNVKIYKDAFDENEANLWSQDRSTLLYINNYIPKSKRFKTTLEEENDFYNNLKLQQKYLLIIKPQSTLINFKLPHTNLGYNSIEYFKGTMYKKIYSSQKNMETNLVITDFDSSVKYDVKTYEELLTYFNRVERLEKFNNPFFESGNILDYESAAEMDVIIKYLYKIRKTINYENYQKIQQL